MSGHALRNLARFARTRVGSRALYGMMSAELGIDRLAALPDALRGDVPLDTRPHPGRPPREVASAELRWPDAPSFAPTATSLAAAYREGRVSPREIVQQALAEARRLARLEPGVGPLCEYADEVALAEAEASARRWREGRPLGPLDGAPWAVKEEVAVRGLPRRVGTAFLSGAPMANDAVAVARVRAAGAITLGLTPMTEYGMTPNGANAHRAMPRNPHAPDHTAGGSSTGSGVAVATGLVPFALGVDGGGSIRIPSALCGVFGLKPTWGRVSRSGSASQGTVAHLGPLGASSVDLALALEAMSGIDPEDPQTFAAPPRPAGSFTAALGRGVRGLVVGVPESEWEDASPAVRHAGKAALAELEREGAKLVPVRLELARYAAAIGYVVIGSEVRAQLRAEWHAHADEMSPDLQVSFAVLEGLSAVDYLELLRLRTGLRRELAGAFRSIDLLALPSTVDTATRVSDADMRSGFLDARVLDGLCRFCFLANLTGLPAASIPLGALAARASRSAADPGVLPIGLQLVGDAWDEATVLAAAAHLERVGVAGLRRPRIAANLPAR